jgi:adenylate cyclase
MPSSHAHALTHWLLAPATRRLPLAELLSALAGELALAGLSVERMRTSVTTMHPEIFVLVVLWHAERGAEVRAASRELMASTTFVASPVAAVRNGAARVRCRLEGPNADLSFDVCRDLASQGMTDYVVFPLVFGTGERTYFSFATKADGGFSNDSLALLEALTPALAARVEVDSARYAMESLLRVYLGQNASERVLAGAFLRGTGQPIEAAVWFCDMRGFTSLADRTPASEVVTILDQFFEAVAGPIAPHGGEVLKFIGDAVLAIFPVGTQGHAKACASALAAAREALGRVEAMAGRDGLPDLGLGIALHVGEVMYGNIGARDRLDFTAIGAVVNEVCRVEGLCRSLGPILMTQAFAKHCDGEVESRGTHSLKGVGVPQELFAPR